MLKASFYRNRQQCVNIHTCNAIKHRRRDQTDRQTRQQTTDGRADGRTRRRQAGRTGSEVSDEMTRPIRKDQSVPDFWSVASVAKLTELGFEHALAEHHRIVSSRIVASTKTCLDRWFYVVIYGYVAFTLHLAY